MLMISLMVGSCNMGPPQGSPETGYTIHGYVGNSTTAAAPNVIVMLFDAETSKPVASDNTNLFGNYKFEHLQPGHYFIKVGEVSMETLIIDKNQRIDIDLSAKGGVMNYAAGAMEELSKSAKSVTPPGQPGGDQDLAKKITGKWYSYSGTSTLSGGGGSESQLAFCADGSYSDNYESGYYGSSNVAGYGTASQQGGSGSWSVDGNAEGGTITVTRADGKTVQIKWQVSDDKGCLLFDGRLHCYNGECK